MLFLQPPPLIWPMILMEGSVKTAQRFSLTCVLGLSLVSPTRFQTPTFSRGVFTYFWPQDDSWNQSRATFRSLECICHLCLEAASTLMGLLVFPVTLASSFAKEVCESSSMDHDGICRLSWGSAAAIFNVVLASLPPIIGWSPMTKV